MIWNQFIPGGVTIQFSRVKYGPDAAIAISHDGEDWFGSAELRPSLIGVPNTQLAFWIERVELLRTAKSYPDDLPSGLIKARRPFTLYKSMGVLIHPVLGWCAVSIGTRAHDMPLGCYPLAIHLCPYDLTVADRTILMDACTELVNHDLE